MLFKVVANFRPCGQQMHIRLPRHGTNSEQLHPRLAAPLKCGSNIDDLKNQLRVIMGLENGFRSNYIQDRENLNAYLAKRSTDLPPRTVRDSFLSSIIPLSSDEKLQEKYSGCAGDVRYGRLVEDIDIFSVMVLQKYILNPRIPIFDPSPYTVVTIMVDSLVFNFLAKPTVDIRISGHIANVGRSSAEVIVWLDQQFGEHWRNITSAKLIMASRDANNKMAAMINPLQPGSPDETTLVQDAKRYRNRLQTRNLYNLTSDFPTAKEQKRLHQLALKTCGGLLSCEERLPMGNRWIGATKVSNTVVAFSDYKNVHNTLFGGYITRHAIELAFAACYLFCRQQGKLRGLTEVKFFRSIPVGSLLRMHAQIAFTKMRFVQVALHAEVQNNRDGLQQATNTFLVTFEMLHPVQEVYPKSYREAMLYLDAGRNLERVAKSIHEPFHHIDYNAFFNNSRNR